MSKSKIKQLLFNYVVLLCFIRVFKMKSKLFKFNSFFGTLGILTSSQISLSPLRGWVL